jgi:hypothetical protein
MSLQPKYHVKCDIIVDAVTLREALLHMSLYFMTIHKNITYGDVEYIDNFTKVEKYNEPSSTSR